MLIRQTINLMKEDKVFTSFYIAGTAIAIASAMVVAIVGRILTSDIAPEVNRHKTCYIDYGGFDTGKEWREWGYSKGCLDGMVKKLECVDQAALTYQSKLRVTATTDQETEKWEQVPGTYIAGDYFSIYEYDFIYGGPLRFDTEDDDQVVITDYLAEKLLGDVDSALGKTIFVNNYTQPKKVVGIVKQTSSLLPDSYAMAFLDIAQYNMTVRRMPQSDFRSALFSQIMVTLKEGNDIDNLRHQFGEAMDNYCTALSQAEGITYKHTEDIKDNFGHYEGSPDGATVLYMLFIILMVILLTLPAINLGGFVTNRMNARLPELGVRKAFGAGKTSLVGLMFTENLLMTIVGGALGFPLAIGFVSLMSDSDLSQLLISRSISTETEYNGTLTMDMVMDPWLIVIVFGCCLLVNTIAALVPSIKVMRKPIVESLNAKK